jgi:hypothetical protein
MFENGEDVRQELRKAHATGDGELSSWVYDWDTRCELLGILECLANAQAQEGAVDSVGVGCIGTAAALVLVGKKWKNLDAGQARNLPETHSGQLALRMEQQERIK